jgi:hypothetical protein
MTKETFPSAQKSGTSRNNLNHCGPQLLLYIYCSWAWVRIPPRRYEYFSSANVHNLNCGTKVFHSLFAHVSTQGCQMVANQNLNMEIFWRALKMDQLEYFTAIWYIL